MDDVRGKSKALAERVLGGERATGLQIWYAFGAMAVFETAGEGLAEGQPVATIEDTAIRLALAFTLGSFLQWLFVGGLWLHLGSRLLGGKASLDESISGFSAAMIFPASIGLLPAILWPHMMENASEVLALVALGLMGTHLLFAVWAWFRGVNAVRHVHRFGLGRAVVVAIWFPALLIGVFAVVFAIAPEVFGVAA